MGAQWSNSMGFTALLPGGVWYGDDGVDEVEQRPGDDHAVVDV